MDINKRRRELWSFAGHQRIKARGQRIFAGLNGIAATIGTVGAVRAAAESGFNTEAALSTAVALAGALGSIMLERASSETTRRANGIELALITSELTPPAGPQAPLHPESPLS